jgi:acyl-CoA synthetase (AMP-forming)/AMP-acid ligase II
MVKRLAGDRAIAGADLSHLKTIIYGGAPMYLADLEDALAVFGPRLAQIYGQGESPMTITGLSKADHADRGHPRWQDHMQSVGVPRTDGNRHCGVQPAKEGGTPHAKGRPGFAAWSSGRRSGFFARSPRR